MTITSHSRPVSRPYFFVSQKELDTLLASFDLDADDFATYQKMLAETMVSAGLNKMERTMVVTLATVVKSRERIIDVIARFMRQPWYRKVKGFFVRHTCQFKYQEDGERFSVLHIPSCAPFVAAWAWARVAADEDATLEMMIKNLWFAQINVDADLLEKQKVWEVDFWRSNGKICSAEFDEDLWLSKASQKWPLFTKDGSRWPMAGTAYTAAEVEEYIKRMRQKHSPISKVNGDHNNVGKFGSPINEKKRKDAEEHI